MEDNVNRHLSSKDLVDYLEKLCDYALSIGMSYEQYWYGEPNMFKNYYNAEQIRQRKKNNEMWIQGAYIYQAIGNLSPILNAFSKEHRAKPYLSKPIPLTEQEQEEQRQEKIQKFIQGMMKKVKKAEV